MLPNPNPAVLERLLDPGVFDVLDERAGLCSVMPPPDDRIDSEDLLED